MKQPPETLKEPRKHGNMEFPCAFYNSIRTITSVSHHWHEEMEILYIEGSGYSVEVDTYDVTTEEPSFYFLNQEQLHSVELSADCLEYAMLFRPDMLSFSSYDLTQQQLLLPLLGQKLLFPSRIPLASPAGQELKTSLLPLLKSAPAPSGSSPFCMQRQFSWKPLPFSAPMSFSFLPNQAVEEILSEFSQSKGS